MNDKLLTVDIVTTFINSHQISRHDLPDLIASVHEAVVKLDSPATVASVPAVNPKKSVFDDHIICLEDGKKFKSLKRHLSTRYGLTPQEYRSKWGLPADYPMVAPSYSKARSQLAKDTGLGRKT